MEYNKQPTRRAGDKGDGKEVKGYLSGKMKRGKVFPMVGEKVEVILDPYGVNASNRIVWLKK